LVAQVWILVTQVSVLVIQVQNFKHTVLFLRHKPPLLNYHIRKLAVRSFGFNLHDIFINNSADGEGAITFVVINKKLFTMTAEVS
jgi:hypothetical protein